MSNTFTAFLGAARLFSGSLPEMLQDTKRRLGGVHSEEPLLIFEDRTGKQVDFDFRGSIEEVLARALPEPVRAGPGRPKLGVTSREISLLPRHWEWLETQANGTSATLRRLVDEARKKDPAGAEARMAIEALGRFMTAIAGNLPGYEEACRALYSGDRDRLRQLTESWPPDVKRYIMERLDQPAALSEI